MALPLVRLSGYMANALIFGIPAFCLLVVRPSLRGLEGPDWDVGRARIAARLEGLVRAGLIATALSAVLYFLLQATVLAEFTGEGMDPDAIGSLMETSFGRWYALRIPLVAALGVLLLGRVGSWATAGTGDGRPAPPAAWWGLWMTLGLGLFVTATFSGHAAVSSPRTTALVNDLLHQVAVGIWFAGVVGLAVVLPEGWASRRVDGLRLLTPAVSRFARVALVSISLAAVTGTINSFLNLQAFGDLLDSSYGRTLALKIALFLLVLMLGGINHYFVRERLQRASRNRTAEPSVRLLFRRTIAAELAIALALMAATGLLVGLARTRPSSAPVSLESRF